MATSRRAVALSFVDSTLGGRRRISVVGALLLVVGAALGCASAPDTTEEDFVGAEAESEAALKTSEHEEITERYCQSEGLSERFCQHLGAEAFNVDRREWDNSSAHAVMGNGQSMCAAARATQERLRQLGSEIHATLRKSQLTKDDGNRLASSLGRALHTLQDNCAHEGMPNPQHSWYSNRGVCASSGEDPDKAPKALQCAHTETLTALKYFVEAMRTAGHAPASLTADFAPQKRNPSRQQACTFLDEWQQFDGKDRRWDNSDTVPSFRTTFIRTFQTGRSSGDVCRDLSPAPARPTVRISNPSCGLLQLYCAGGDDNAENPLDRH